VAAVDEGATFEDGHEYDHERHVSTQNLLDAEGGQPNDAANLAYNVPPPLEVSFDCAPGATRRQGTSELEIVQPVVAETPVSPQDSSRSMPLSPDDPAWKTMSMKPTYGGSGMSGALSSSHSSKAIAAFLGGNQSQYEDDLNCPKGTRAQRQRRVLKPRTGDYIMRVAAPNALTGVDCTNMSFKEVLHLLAGLTLPVQMLMRRSVPVAKGDIYWVNYEAAPVDRAQVQGEGWANAPAPPPPPLGFAVVKTILTPKDVPPIVR
jgi:hypothetical protein